MKFNIGDKVRFLDAVGGGIIQSINESVALILTDDGFEYPSALSEIIKVENDNFNANPRRSSEIKNQSTPTIQAKPKDLVKPKKPEILIKGNDTLRVHLAFVPTDDRTPTYCDLDLYLVNDSNLYLLYTYYAPSETGLAFKRSGKLDPNTKVKIDTVGRDNLNKMEKVLVQLIAFNKTGNKPMHPLHVELSIQTTWFFRNAKYKQNAFFHEESILYELTENPMAQAVERLTPESIQKVIKQQALLGQEVDKSLIAKKKKERFPEEKIVDLHIHEIVEEEAGLKSGEMLELQMAKFEEELNACLKSPTKKIVFIHGVGNGKLKHELRKRLERKYPKLQFQDASFAEYGWGATLVYLQ